MSDPHSQPLACVIGDMDLVRPLGLAGIRSAVLAQPGELSRYSRFTATALDWADSSKEPARLLDILLDFGRRQPEPPILYYGRDWDLLLVSRERERLREAFRFAVADRELVEWLVDKARFQELAERLELPLPASRRLSPHAADPTDVDLQFPLIAKPLTRRNETWKPIAGGGKAVEARTPAALRELWPRLAAAGVDVLVQELIPGPETRVESYHVYVDGRGEIAGEFTGRKIRTYPPAYGYSTAVEITDQADVAELGRDVVGRLGLRGVAKLDFKRAPDGRLRLLEVNPRFNLWHHVGAKAGVNLPALVYADLAGTTRPPARRARAGVRWCYHRNDARAAKAHGIPLARWLPWALSCEAKSAVAWDDPMPIVRGSLARLSQRARSSRAGARR
jgi:D-aspartate ligase